jgi:hypothetical protein
MLELTEAQRFEQAVQRSIEVTLAIPEDSRVPALIVGIKRLSRYKNRGGRPIKADAAVAIAQHLLEALTDEPNETWEITRKEIEDENV